MNHELIVLKPGDPLYEEPRTFQMQRPCRSHVYRGWAIKNCGWQAQMERAEMTHCILAAKMISEVPFVFNPDLLYVAYPGGSGIIRQGEYMDLLVHDGQIPICEYVPKEEQLRRMAEVEFAEFSRIMALIDQQEDAEAARTEAA